MFNFNRTKIDNYIAQVKANQNISNVVETLDLRTSIYNVGRIKKSIGFGAEIPFNIKFKTNEFNSEIELHLKPNNSIIEFEGKKIWIFL